LTIIFLYDKIYKRVKIARKQDRSLKTEHMIKEETTNQENR